jgi:hypothetical protein
MWANDANSNLNWGGKKVCIVYVLHLQVSQIMSEKESELQELHKSKA